MTGEPTSPMSPEELREAVAAVERTGLFDRKPNQGRLFRYLASRLLAGDQSSVKEYVLGVEALGRPAEFDPKTDSIVRVEVRKLRQTLEDHFLTGAGKDAPVVLRVPKGAYALEAVRRQERREPAPPPAQHRRFPRAAVLTALLALGAISAAAWFLLRSQPPRGETSAAVPPPQTPLPAVRILAGNLAEGFTDAAGRHWDTDRFFDGGIAVSQMDVPVTNVEDPKLFQFHREGQFQYHIPLAPGLYELRLYFAEFLYGPGSRAGGGEVSRVFRILANGRVIDPALDVISIAPGRGVGMRRVYLNMAPASDGKLHLDFQMLRPDKAFVNAIEIVPGIKDRMLPVRMVAGSKPFTDPAGNLWEPDSFVIGGRREPRSRTIEDAPAQALFQSERFGHFTYHLHVVPGHTYRLNLWMSEQFFGLPGASATGNRLFDLYLAGATLLKSFDPLREARGPARAVRRSFPNIKPDALGAIRLQFVPVRNYAVINALDLIDEGPE